MGLYNKPALDLLGALINRDNPELKTRLSSTNIVVLGGPYTTSLGVSGRNSRVLLNGVAGTGISGKKEFFYDRINIGTLLNGITVVFNGSDKAATIADLLPALNEQYGLGLVANDITNPTTKLGNGYTPTPLTLTISTSSLAYTGTLNVVWTRAPAGIYPDSGPGTKMMLRGDMSAGYFGKVAQDELFTIPELTTELFPNGIPAGGSSVVNNAMYWLKFALNNQIVYFPSALLYNGISWDAISGMGGVFGNRKSPLFTEHDGMQYFQPRLPSMGDTDPMPPSRDPTSTAARLFNKVHAGTYGTGEWDQLQTTLDLSSTFWWLNTRSDVADPKPAFVTEMSQVNVGDGQKSLALRYRPMLVLVDGKLYLMAMRNLEGKLLSPIKPIDVHVTLSAPENQLRGMQNIQGQLLLATPKPVMQPPVFNTIGPMKDLRGGKTIKSFGVSFAVETRIALNTTNGQLTGFTG